jgi:hypothetical protein
MSVRDGLLLPILPALGGDLAADASSARWRYLGEREGVRGSEGEREGETERGSKRE